MFHWKKTIKKYLRHFWQVFSPQQILDLTFNLYLVRVQSFMPPFSAKEIGIVEIQNMYYIYSTVHYIQYTLYCSLHYEPYDLMLISNLMSVRLWNFKDGGVLKWKSFAQVSTCSKDIFLKQSYYELWFVKKCRNRTFKVNFLC